MLYRALAVLQKYAIRLYDLLMNFQKKLQANYCKCKVIMMTYGRGKYSLNYFIWHRVHISHILSVSVNIMSADALATVVARASAAMILIYVRPLYWLAASQVCCNLVAGGI